MSSDLLLFTCQYTIGKPFAIKDAGGQPRIITETGQPLDLLLIEAVEKHSDQRWEKIIPLQKMGNAGYILSLLSPKGSNFVFRYYPHQNLLTIDLQGLPEMDPKVMTVNYFNNLVPTEWFLMDKLPFFEDGDYVPIPRGSKRPADKLYVSEENQVFIYDKELCDVDSQYQNIIILHTIFYGAALFLDGEINLAESDLVYTHSLMNRQVHSYKDKEVLILGGGDGALLYELLKESPKFVTMVELDEMVMKMCAKHMKSVCGDVLDGDRKGPNYQVIVGDCFEHIERYIKEGKKFDFVFSDLTDVPVAEEDEDEEEEMKKFWSLMTKDVTLSMKVLKPGGRFITHLVGDMDPRPVVPHFEKLLTSMHLSFERRNPFIPSFGDDWIMYDVFAEGGKH